MLPMPISSQSYLPPFTTSATLSKSKRLWKSSFRFLSFNNIPPIHLTICLHQTLQIFSLHCPWFCIGTSLADCKVVNGCDLNWMSYSLSVWLCLQIRVDMNTRTNTNILWSSHHFPLKLPLSLEFNKCGLRLLLFVLSISPIASVFQPSSELSNKDTTFFSSKCADESQLHIGLTINYTCY